MQVDHEALVKIRPLICAYAIFSDSYLNGLVQDYLAGLCDGDARVALNSLDAVLSAEPTNGATLLTKEMVAIALQKTHLLYDKGGKQK